MAEKLELTREEAKGILWGETEGYKIIKDEIVNTTRWSVVHSLVIQRESDGKYFQDNYCRGATECQDESPWEYNPPNFDEVEPVETKIITYVRVA